MPTTEANYDAPIQLLKDRYDNEILITKAHLNNIFKIDSMKKDSADSLRKLIGIFNENEMALSGLGIDTKSCDFVWVHILSEKLDSETPREWQLSNADGKLQSMEELRKFLECRARALEASGRSLETTRELTERAERETCQSYQSNSMSCPVCCVERHIGYTPVQLSCLYHLMKDIKGLKNFDFALTV